MKKNTLDMSLKKFKHVKSTPDATTLQHQDGHILTIAHKNLDPATKAQLQALSKISGQDETPQQATEQRDQKMAHGGISNKTIGSLQPNTVAAECEGGKIKMADGGQASGGPMQMVSKLAPLAMMMAQGGPSQPLNSVQQAEEDARHVVAQRHQDASQQAIDKGDYDESERQTHQANAAIGNPQAQGGEIRKAYAGGDEVFSQDQAPMIDTGPTPNMSQDPEDKSMDEFKRSGGFNPKAPEFQIDPKVQAMRDRYDQLVGNPEQTFKAAKGQAPLNFQPNIAQAAQEDVTKQLAANDSAKSAQNSALIQKNKMLADMGLPPDPNDPTTMAAATPQPQGTTANPAPQYAGQLPNIGPDGKQAPMDQQGIPSDLQSAYDVGMAGIGQQEAANTEMGQAIGERGTAEAAAAQRAANAENTVRKHFQTEFNAAETELQAQIKDYQNGEIDPEQYWHGTKNPQTGQMEGGHSKLLAGLSMILGGFNPTNRPNAGIEMVNQKINQNIQAQMTNLNAKHNIVRANLDHYHDLNTALDMSRLMLNQSAQHSLQAISSKFAGPIAQAQYKALNGQLEKNKAQLMQQFAMTKTMFNLGNNVKPDGQHAAMSPDDQIAAYTSGIKFMRASGQLDNAKDLEAHVIPGVGISPNQTPSEAQKALLTGHRTVNNMFNDSLQFSEQYGGKNWLKYSPEERIKIMQKGATLQNQLIGTVKQAQHDGVYKPSEADFLLRQIGNNPASFTANFSSVPGIQEMQQLKAQEYATQAKSLGIDNFKPLEQYNPIKYHKGIPVRKGPDGNYPRVK